MKKEVINTFKRAKTIHVFFLTPSRRVMHFSLENFFWRFLSHIKSTSLSRVSMKVLLTRGKRIKYHPTLTYITFVRQKLLCTHREPYSYKPAATLFACLLHKHFLSLFVLGKFTVIETLMHPHRIFYTAISSYSSFTFFLFKFFDKDLASKEKITSA